MKSNSFVCTTAIILIARFTNWIAKPSKLLNWWQNFLDWRYQRQGRRRRNRVTFRKTMYEFKPFELKLCDYKSYPSKTNHGRGINFIPKPRSGHRMVASETDLFCFGGKFHLQFIYAHFKHF